MLKVWGRASSSNVMKVMWAISELKLPHERIDVGGKFGGLDQPTYKAMNPNQKVPTLQDGKLTLWESNAIVRYISDTYGKGTLSPTDPIQRAHADQWIDWAATGFTADVMGGVFVPLAYQLPAQRDTKAIEAAAKRAGDRLEVLDTQLAGRPFILGDALTMADIVVAGAMHRYYTLPITRPPRANVEAYYQRLTQRPTYRDNVMFDWRDLKVPGA
jgi:glutathione S-transferase